MAIIGAAVEPPRTDDQPLFLRDREAHLDAELVGLARLSFPDAFNFRRMQCVEFVLVLRTLAANAPGPLKPDAELCLPFVRTSRQLAFGIALPSLQLKNAARQCVRQSHAQSFTRWHLKSFTKPSEPSVSRLSSAMTNDSDNVMPRSIFSTNDFLKCTLNRYAERCAQTCCAT